MGLTWLSSFLNLGGSAPYTHWMGGWLDALEKRKISSLLTGIELWFVSHPVFTGALFWLFQICYSVRNVIIITYFCTDRCMGTDRCIGKVQNVSLKQLDRLIQWTTDSSVMFSAAHWTWTWLIPNCCAFYLCMCPVSSCAYKTVSFLLILSGLAALTTEHRQLE